MDILQKFNVFKEAFEKTILWSEMVSTVENSPWHREANVAVHTEMAIDYYINTFSESRTERQQALTLLALLFHDTGKPKARTEKFSEERGVYYSYPRHELISARIFEDYAVTHWNRWQQLSRLFDLTEYDLYRITWMIEKHLPYELRKPEKLNGFLTAAYSILGDDVIAFTDMIQSDSNGRISDDAENKLKAVTDWVEMFECYEQQERFIDDNAPEIVILIGASGSGKSTISKEYRDKGYSYYSLDALRFEFALAKNIIKDAEVDTVKGYNKAYDYCSEVNRSGFNGYANDRFIKFMKDYDNVIIDNVNSTSKVRKRYVAEAKKRGYKITMVTFPITKPELLRRQKSRADKEVPIAAVLRQYHGISMPMLGYETDKVIVKPNF